jgi:hypothetical protein
MKKMSAILGLIIIISILLVGSITTGVISAVAASPCAFSNTTFPTANQAFCTALSREQFF